MSNAGGYVMTRTHGSDRFYNPPVVRRNQQLMLKQQQQITRHLQSKRPLRSESRLDLAEADTRTDSDESTLSIPNSGYSSSPPRTVHFTNLDRLIESVTPHVDAQFLSEPRTRGQKNREADVHPYFCLADLWESFQEHSFYGVEVPMLFNESDSVKQYFVPLSGIQLYIDPHRRRSSGGGSDADFSRESSSDCEAEKHARVVTDGARIQHNLVKLSSQRMGKLTLSDRPPLNSSSHETEVSSLPGQLLFQYFELKHPHLRPPFSDKISSLAAKFPILLSYRSCDLLPESWFCVAWYPIYRIPAGQTFIKGKVPLPLHASSGRKFHSLDTSPMIYLPVFGLAFDKLRGSVMTPNGASEWQHVNSLCQAADNWLRKLRVSHPDHQFFISRNLPWMIES